MKTICAAGVLGRDAEHRQTQQGDNICNFSIAVDDGFGDRKTTIWFDVTRWGKGAEGLSRVLVKGSRVAVSGDLSTREHNGKTYLQIRADKVTILSTPQGGQKREEPRQSSRDALDDDLPDFDAPF